MSHEDCVNAYLAEQVEAVNVEDGTADMIIATQLFINQRMKNAGLIKSPMGKGGLENCEATDANLALFGETFFQALKDMEKEATSKPFGKACLAKIFYAALSYSAIRHIPLVSKN